MARKRMLKQEFFTSRPLNELPIPVMVTFAGLWCYVDDYGRGEDDVSLIRATIWPRRREVTEVKVEQHLDALDEKFLICRYLVGGIPLLHVVNWIEHQQVSHPTRSKVPPCAHHDPARWELFLGDTNPALEKFLIPSGGFPENVTRRSGATPTQFSSVQFSLAKSKGAAPRTNGTTPELDLAHG